MVRIGSFIVLTRKNKSEVFLVKRSDFPVWECQGGGIESGETPEKCAIREAYEETGFKVKIIRKVAVYTNYKSKTVDSHLYEGEYISGEFKPEYKKCEGKWFNVNNLPKQMTAKRKIMIFDCLKNSKELIKKYDINNFSPHDLKLLFLLPIPSLKFLLRRLFLL
jgi:ADP-ribose pyrophosphatase YjhB (NUDIX family)